MSNNRYKILIVEDDRHIASLLSNLAEAGGYQALCAKNCAEGLLMFSSHLPDLVLLDLGLPDQDGSEIIRSVRERSGVPIIVLSARSDEQEKVAALDLGANDYVTKPFGAEELMALLNRHHGSREKAAAELGISKTTLWRRMRKYGISKDLTME